MIDALLSILFLVIVFAFLAAREISNDRDALKRWKKEVTDGVELVEGVGNILLLGLGVLAIVALVFGILFGFVRLIKWMWNVTL